MRKRRRRGGYPLRLRPLGLAATELTNWLDRTPPEKLPRWVNKLAAWYLRHGGGNYFS